MLDLNRDPMNQYTDTHRALWRAKAMSQGIVCVVCGRVPRLERRPAFFDTGLCRACASELDVEQPNDAE